MARIHVTPTGEWLDSPVDLSDAELVASSRSGATEVWRGPDGALWEVAPLRSGDVEVTPLHRIPDHLVLRY